MLCVNTCHVLREHEKFDEFAGPRFFVRMAGLKWHPPDTESRIPQIKDDFGIGYCNITRCCTEVCPAGINATDNAIIPLKERVVTEYYDPISMIAKRKLESSAESTKRLGIGVIDWQPPRGKALRRCCVILAYDQGRFRHSKAPDA